MEEYYSYDKLKRTTIFKKLFNSDGTERINYLATVIFYRNMANGYEYVELNEKGDIIYHLPYDQKSSLSSLEYIWYDYSPDLFDSSGKLKEGIIDNDCLINPYSYEYDNKGNVSSRLRLNIKGELIFEKMCYDEMDRKIKTEILFLNGDEKIIREYYDKKTCFWQERTIELNGELIKYRGMVPNADPNVTITIDFIFRNDKTIIENIISNYANQTLVRWFYENNVLIKKEVSYFLDKLIHPDKMLTYIMIEGELKLSEEKIYEYEFYQN